MSSSRRGMFRAAARAAARAGLEAAEAKGLAEDALRPAESPFTDEERDRYARQFALHGWGEAEQLGLRDASVLVIGAGALGGPVAHTLVGAGVGRLGIVDDDTVRRSDLHRQPLHTTQDVGSPKAHSAAATLQTVNPESMVEPYQMRVDADNVDGLIVGHDLVVDCSEDDDTRYRLNRACCAAGVELVEGGAVGVAGLVLAIRPGHTACYRCAFPQGPSPEARASGEAAGILAPAAGVVGNLMAFEALKLLSGYGEPALDALTEVDLGGGTLTRVATVRRDDCPDCGDAPAPLP